MRAARAWALFSGSRSERGKAPAGNGWGAALPCGGIRHFQSRRCVKERRPGFVTGLPRASGRCPSPLPLRAQVYARRETPPDVCGGIRMFFRVPFFVPALRVAGGARNAGMRRRNMPERLSEEERRGVGSRHLWERQEPGCGKASGLFVVRGEESVPPEGGLQKASRGPVRSWSQRPCGTRRCCRRARSCRARRIRRRCCGRR